MPEQIVQSKNVKRMVPLRYVLTPILIIFSALIILMVVGALASKPAKKPIAIRAPLVEVVELTSSTVQFSIASQGTVMPRTQTNLISEVSGLVTQVSEKFFVGGFFEKGEEILRIDDITYQVAVLQAESRLGAAESALISERAQSKQAEDEWLLTGKALDDAPVLALRIPQLKQAEANLIAAKADLTEAKTKLERTRIIAPYGAMIKAKKVDIGQYVTIGASIANTFAVDYAEVRLPVKQRDVAFLNLPKINQNIGQTSNVELYYQLNGRKFTWPSHIARYEGVVDTASRVHYVVAQIDDPYQMLEGTDHNDIHIGTFVNAIIEGKKVSDVVSIPRRAVHGANTLYLIDADNKLYIQEIDILRADAEHVYTQQIITSNLRLVLTNIEAPVNGMSLRVSGEASEKENTETVTQVDSAVESNNS